MRPAKLLIRLARKELASELVELGTLTMVMDNGAGRTNATEFPKGGPLWFAPLFETADPRYAWLNALQALAKGHASGPNARFEVWEPR